MSAMIINFIWASLLLLCASNFYVVTRAQNDVTVLYTLRAQWKNTPPNWGTVSPCEWDGVTCINSRVTRLTLPSLGLRGTLTGDIGELTELKILDLSSNKELTGPLPPSLGKLMKLNILSLSSCSFTGTIPKELGDLIELTFFALDSNKLTGRIPPSLGRLSKVVWLDMAGNQLSGTIPVSTDTEPGLDQLFQAKHFHFNKNELSGSIDPKLFSSKMILIHILFDGNRFTGDIPITLGQVATMEVVRLDRNFLSGPIPTTLSNLTKLTELNLADNRLTGSLPDLKALLSLSYVDLSNNAFNKSNVPDWLPRLENLHSLVIENASLQGSFPTEFLRIRVLQQVSMKNNNLSGVLNLGDRLISKQLQLIDLKNNQISLVSDLGGYSKSLILVENWVCREPLNKPYCNAQKSLTPYSTNLNACSSITCSSDQGLNPTNCKCANPYQGNITFRAPLFSDLSDREKFQKLEESLWSNLSLASNSVLLDVIGFDSDKYIKVKVSFFPSVGSFFNRTEIVRIVSELSQQKFKPPSYFGPYVFQGFVYSFEDTRGGSSNTGIIIGVSVGCAVFILILIILLIYTFLQKKKARRIVEQNIPFASWGPNNEDMGDAPIVKGARWFSYDELKKCTNNFSSDNEIGEGGYGKVYRGVTSNGQVVAVKKSQQGSMQGGLEFKTEIELLSRVHHKNLVTLVGFCFEKKDHILVYEFISNGTLRDGLSGRSGIQLDWRRRLLIALDSARGLAYLHELADPPIIHRDIKSTNILLDEKLTAKVADFGLSKLMSDSPKGHVSTQVKGTFGYMDPEYYMTQQLTDKSDVYSFGVVMLELVTGRLPIQKSKYIVREVQTAMDKTDHFLGLSDLIDASIRNSNVIWGFRRFVNLALQCVLDMAEGRPTMNEVVKDIESIIQIYGLHSNLNSGSSSATDFTSRNQHPYADPLLKNCDNSNDFDYSSSYAMSAKIEPK